MIADAQETGGEIRQAARGIDPYRDALGGQEQSLQRQEDDLGVIDEALAKSLRELTSSATLLSKARGKVSKKLAAEAQKHLVDLGMQNATLEARLDAVPLGADDVPASGLDHLELMLTANPGEPARPLRKVASGGEMSRTMLGHQDGARRARPGSHAGGLR